MIPHVHSELRHLPCTSFLSSHLLTHFSIWSSNGNFSSTYCKDLLCKSTFPNVLSINCNFSFLVVSGPKLYIHPYFLFYLFSPIPLSLLTNCFSFISKCIWINRLFCHFYQYHPGWAMVPSWASAVLQELFLPTLLPAVLFSVSSALLLCSVKHEPTLSKVRVLIKSFIRPQNKMWCLTNAKQDVIQNKMANDITLLPLLFLHQVTSLSLRTSISWLLQTLLPQHPSLWQIVGWGSKVKVSKNSERKLVSLEDRRVMGHGKTPCPFSLKT